MKLKNKRTGEIINNNGINFVEGNYKTYNSIAEFNEEWEDYEEPKYYWYIDDAGVIQIDEVLSSEINMRKSIGNYFETREEAEKAVEKLKAVKRLKDKGFRFTLTPGIGSLDITPGKFQIEINAEMPEKWFCCDAMQKDLDDCFGGEK